MKATLIKRILANIQNEIRVTIEEYKKIDFPDNLYNFIIEDFEGISYSANYGVVFDSDQNLLHIVVDKLLAKIKEAEQIEELYSDHLANYDYLKQFEGFKIYF